MSLKAWSENSRLLQRIRQGLRVKGIEAKLALSGRAGRETSIGRLNNDCRCLGFYAKPSLIRMSEEVTDRLELPWKHMLAKLGLRVLLERLTWIEVEDLVREIRRLRRRTLEVSKSYLKAARRKLSTQRLPSSF